MPKISIIIPVYNVEKYLRRCLDSVLNQTFTDWNAICVNDGSPDGCDKILDEYAARDKRFIILNKENGGLADARNFGMARADGEYIMFLDSDDFIHPQTMEITYKLAQRDNTDMVAFRFDWKYRKKLSVLYKQGENIDNIVPDDMDHRYDIDKIKTRVTRNIFRYATDRSTDRLNPRRKWLVKHCHVVKALYRREFIADIPFIKGLLYEDFPWWSAVMLKKPHVTIAPLPLYYYMPNFSGIALTSTHIKIVKNKCVGAIASYENYSQNANRYQMWVWSRKFLWRFIRSAYRNAVQIDNDADLAAARDAMRALDAAGVLDSAPNMKWRRVRDDIRKFINGEK